MRLFRSISEAEHQNLLASGKFQQAPESMEGKWFAETFENAVEWGKQLERERDFWVVEIDIFDEIANNLLFIIDFLDGIGPARYAELNDLTDAIIVDTKFIKHT